MTALLLLVTAAALLRWAARRPRAPPAPDGNPHGPGGSIPPAPHHHKRLEATDD
jgi:hypothetical protein